MNEVFAVARVLQVREEQLREQWYAHFTTTTTTAPKTVGGVNHGPHSDAWWHGVSVCEQGGRNHPFFGYFSIMDGSAGGLPWATQVQMANRIIERHGDYAWARACVAAGYRASPGG